MAQEIHQRSRHHPTVVFDGSLYHMVFSVNDDSNRILYVTSLDGENAWTLGPDPEQTTFAAPALVLSRAPSRQPNLLVLVFVANDDSGRILYATLDLNENPDNRGWRFRGQVGGESAQDVFALATGHISDRSITVYFQEKNRNNRLLELEFTP